MDWELTNLGEVIDLQKGISYKSKFLDKEGPLLLGLGCVRPGGGIQLEKAQTYSGPFDERHAIRPGELIITMTDITQDGRVLGSPVLIPMEPPSQKYIISLDVAKVELIRPDLMDLKFLFYLLQTYNYRYFVYGYSTGTTIRRVSKIDVLNHYRFLRPPLPEQRAITHVLGTLDDQIELNRRMNQTLEETAQALFKSMFVDFDGHDDFVDSELGPIPRGWEVKPLDQIATYLNGAACQKYPAKDGEDRLPVIKIRELKHGITPNTDMANVAVPAKFIVNDGDVLFSWSGSLRVKVWTGGKGFLNQHLFKVTSADYPKWFYYFWTFHYMKEFQRIAEDKTTTMGHIKRQHLSESLVVVPPAQVITDMDNSFRPLIEQGISRELESRTLASLRDTLLPKLISGKLRVPEAERMMEAAA